MNTCIRAIILSALIVGVIGGFTNTCYDIYGYCEPNPHRCLTPHYYSLCRKTCGCRGTCIDSNEKHCLNSFYKCVKEPNRRFCPRFCGLCNNCYNIVHDHICHMYARRCNDYNVRYFCSGTCGRCREHCYNRLLSDDVCNNLHARGFCQRRHPHHQIMWIACYATCTSGCINNRLS